MKLISNRKAVAVTALSLGLALMFSPAAFAITVQDEPATDNTASSAAYDESNCVSEVCREAAIKIDAQIAASVPESVKRAQSCLGVPYGSGGAGPDYYDCSGLVSYALTGEYRHAYTSYDFWSMPEVEDPQPGDVVACHAGHCGLYIGDGQMIHAPQSGEDVRIEPMRGKIVRP